MDIQLPESLIQTELALKGTASFDPVSIFYRLYCSWAPSGGLNGTYSMLGQSFSASST